MTPLGALLGEVLEQVATTKDRKVLDSLRFRIERLIDQELSATPPRKGRTARESAIVQPELFDDQGRLIFG